MPWGKKPLFWINKNNKLRIMEKLKVLFITLLVSFMPLFMTSCEDDEDEENSILNELVGTWEYKYPVAGIYISETFEFTKNSKYTWSVGGSTLEEGVFIIDSDEILLVPDDPGLAESILLLEDGYLYDELDHKYKKIK